MTSSALPVAVLGATGPTGIHLVPRLLDRGRAVRVVSRDPDRSPDPFAGLEVERHAADLLTPGAAEAALAGCDLAFNCVGLPADAIHRHGELARRVTEAATAAGCRLVHISSYWAYLPLRSSPLDEDHPREGGGPWVRARREAEEVHLAAGAAVVHLPDFFGPWVHTSTLQQPLVDAAGGRAMNWIGGAEVAREYIYVPDAMATVAALGEQPDARGRRWIVPGSGPLTGRRAAEIVEGVLGRPVKLRAAPLWLLRLLGLFNRDLRGFLQMAPDYVKPIAYDGSRLESLLGPQPRAGYEEALRATLEWIGER